MEETKQASVTNLNKIYATTTVKLRLKKSTKSSGAKIMVNQVNSVATKKTLIVSDDKTSFTTWLSNLLDSDLLAELTTEDSQVGPLWEKILTRDRERFIRMWNYIASFWEDSAVVSDCVNLDNRLAFSLCLGTPVLNRLHRTHPGQEGIRDDAFYILWPRMHRQIIELCNISTHCSKYGKNIKTSRPFNSSSLLPDLTVTKE